METIDQLIFTALFSDNTEEKHTARQTIRTQAQNKGIFSASLYPFYMAIGKGAIPTTFTVPAFNIRTLTYDISTLLFTLAKKYAIGPFIFEIARSEIDYTDQKPEEYAIAVLAGAIKADYTGPVFLQGDHYQLSKNKYTKDPQQEIEKIKNLVKESIDAQFYNIDIDASTLVDLDKPTQTQQQETNAHVTAELTQYIRSLEPKETTISIGGEIGHIGGKNSTPEELKAFMDNYCLLIGNTPGISKISVQTGTSHGGIPLPDGTMAQINLDFAVIAQTGDIARKECKIGGVVQHGASTLPNDLFDQFPKNKTLEIHLATGFQNIVYDTVPQEVKQTMYTWIETNLQNEKEEGWSTEQFIYKTRKKAFGPFKKALFELSQQDKKPILLGLEKQFEFLFEKLQVFDTRKFIDIIFPVSSLESDDSRVTT